VHLLVLLHKFKYWLLLKSLYFGHADQSSAVNIVTGIQGAVLRVPILDRQVHFSVFKKFRLRSGALSASS